MSSETVPPAGPIIFQGKVLAQKIQANLKSEIEQFRAQSQELKLAAVFVGDNAGSVDSLSQTYVQAVLRFMSANKENLLRHSALRMT